MYICVYIHLMESQIKRQNLYENMTYQNRQSHFLRSRHYTCTDKIQVCFYILHLGGSPQSLPGIHQYLKTEVGSTIGTLFEIYVLAEVPTWDSAHSWGINSAAPPKNQSTCTMTSYSTQSHCACYS